MPVHRSRRSLASTTAAACLLLCALPSTTPTSILASSELVACTDDGSVSVHGGVMDAETRGERALERVVSLPSRKGAPSRPLFPSLSTPPPHQSPSLNCTTKLLVTLAVDAGSALTGTTRLDTSLTCTGSPTGACPCPCSAATTPGCTCVDFGSPLSISLTKTPAYLTYPLTYVQSFNAKPAELIIRTGLGFPSLACADGAAAPAPTCGWATDPVSGAPVPASQGFCCACSLDQAGSDTFGGGSSQSMRDARNGV